MKKIFLAKNQLVDTDKKYIVTCEKHNTFVGVDLMNDAKRIKTKEFCDECKGGDKI